ncbi:DUF1329 domain-containing protein [Candidatus Binatus sp.]|uniref:DUF1329 domain-containing protein n=1 Tax=Candidatus Binatus sp. TaxID=2811406 RepID=UPI003BB0AC90
MILPIRSVVVATHYAFVMLNLFSIFTANAFAQQSATTANPASASAPQSGSLINTANASNYSRFLPPGADVAIKYGLAMRVVSSKRLDWSAGFTAETEQYSGQVRLDDEDDIVNYVAGMPFPTVSTSEPKAAIKIAYNWHMGPFMPDDFSQEPWGSFAYSSTDSLNGFVPEEWNNYTCTQFVFLRYAHRTEVDPRPTLGPKEDGVEWKARCLYWNGGPDMSPCVGGTGFVVRYLDPHKPDAEYLSGGGSRRYGGRVVISDEKCRGCHQPFWAYALPKTEEYSYRLLGTTLMLACLTADHEPAGIVERNSALAFGEEAFQLRNAYILEMTPKVSGHENVRTIVYIDAEAYVWLGAEFFAGNEQTEAAFPFWRSHPSPSGGYLFDLAGEFYVPFDQLTSHHFLGGATSRLFFRSLAPAHGEFSQKINTGKVSVDLFDPDKLAR